MAHLGLEVDGRAQEVEGRRVLLHGEVDQAQVVQDPPVKGRKIRCPLQTTDGLGTPKFVVT